MTRSAGPTDAAPGLIVLAAGLSTRFGRPKQIEAVAPGGQALMDLVVYDALRAGCGHVVVVVGGASATAVEERVRTLLAGTGVGVDFAHQRLDDLPGGRRPPPDREKPWGTAHAVLAAAPFLRGDFLVANTDDFYWPEAYRAVVEELRSDDDDAARARVRGAVPAYRLRDTLPEPDGDGVSRALLEVEDGWVKGITEGKELRDDGGRIVGKAVQGHPLEPPGEQRVSMNLWGLRRGVVAELERLFGRFLDEHGDTPGAEFLLSEALDGLVRDGKARIRALPMPRAGFGITFPGDVPWVKAKLALVASSEGYPADLAADLRARSRGPASRSALPKAGGTGSGRAPRRLRR